MTEMGGEIARARAALMEAELTERPGERYLLAHRAAGQVAAIVLATRCRPGVPVARRNLWRVLAGVAPELAEWAGFFLALQGRCELVRAGAGNLVSTREADDLVRDADRFLAVVERALGLTPHAAVGDQLAGRAAG